MLLTAVGEVGILPTLLAGFGHDPLNHGLQMGSITGVVADRPLHDDLVGAIAPYLAVVALDPAVPTFEDLAVWIREISLGVGFGVAGGSGAQVAIGHRQRVNATQLIRA